MTDALPPSAAQLLINGLPIGDAACDAAFARVGLDRRSFAVLTMILWNQGITEQELGDRLHIAGGTIRRFVAELAEQALVVGASYGSPLRSTAAGLECHTMAVEAAWDAQAHFVDPLQPVTRETMRWYLVARSAEPDRIEIEP